MQRPNPNQQFQLQQQQSQQKSMVMQQSSTSSSVQQQSSQQFMSQEFSQQQQFSSQQRISQQSVSRQVTQQRGQFHRKSAPKSRKFRLRNVQVRGRQLGVTYATLPENHPKPCAKWRTKWLTWLEPSDCDNVRKKYLKSAWKTLKNPLKSRKNTRRAVHASAWTQLARSCVAKNSAREPRSKILWVSAIFKPHNFSSRSWRKFLWPDFLWPTARRTLHKLSPQKKEEEKKECSRRPLRALVGEGMSARAASEQLAQGSGKVGKFRRHSRKFGNIRKCVGEEFRGLTNTCSRACWSGEPWRAGGVRVSRRWVMRCIVLVFGDSRLTKECVHAGVAAWP